MHSASDHLRDLSQFQWYVVPLLLLVIYVYANEIQRRDWSVVFAGVALWGMDWFNEIWNAVLAHVAGRPAWGAPGESAYRILVGLNIEICLMFAVLGVAAAKLLPPDRGLKILGVPNRWLLAGVNAVVAVGIELVLHQAGGLIWTWSWWGAGFPFLIWLIGYLPFFVVCFWVHDMPRVRSKVTAVGVILAVDACGLVVFGALGWI